VTALLESATHFFKDLILIALVLLNTVVAIAKVAKNSDSANDTKICLVAPVPHSHSGPLLNSSAVPLLHCPNA
jgi:hypothetical protein